MKKIYRVERKRVGGSWERNKTFTNKREARSFAFHWINDRKYEHRSKSGDNDRDYGELEAIVYMADDYGDCIHNEELIAIYR